MPLLLSLKIHDALEEVQAELEDGELLFAFLDDVQFVCATAFAPLRLSTVAGIRLHDGKIRVWIKARECPENEWRSLVLTSGIHRVVRSCAHQSFLRTVPPSQTNKALSQWVTIFLLHTENSNGKSIICQNCSLLFQQICQIRGGPVHPTEGMQRRRESHQRAGERSIESDDRP